MIIIGIALHCCIVKSVMLHISRLATSKTKIPHYCSIYFLLLLLLLQQRNNNVLSCHDFYDDDDDEDDDACNVLGMSFSQMYKKLLKLNKGELNDEDDCKVKEI